MKNITEVPPYPSYLHMHYHPGRLGFLAKARGLAPPPVDKCRLLDIGCGDGTSLLTFGFGLPDARFTGVDLDADLIANGTRAACDLGLSNVELRALDATRIGAEFGQFDYIAAHGFYSWVPHEVREKLWDVLSERLAPNGLVYISFNAYPGCHFREASRKFLQFHLRNADSAPEIMREAESMLRFVSAGDPEDHLYRRLIQEEAEAMLDRKIEQLFFDELSPFYFPFYLNEFLERASQAGFEYVSESSWAEMSALPFPPRMRQAMEAIPDWPKRMQYRDFFGGCRFHRVVLCRKGAGLSEIDANAIDGTYVTGEIDCAGTTPDGLAEFRGGRGAELRTKDPVAVAALSMLAAKRPAPVAFGELLRAGLAVAGPDASADDCKRRLCATLRQLADFDAATFSLHAPPAKAEAGERPVASPIARRQLQTGRDAFSLFGATVEIQDAQDRALIAALDGGRDRIALAEQIGLDADDLERRLAYFARNGFLVA